MVPSMDQCIALMAHYQMLENIKAHSLVVERVASLIARNLRKAGERIALEEVSAGALMHDIAKTECLLTKEDHAKKGKQICLDHHFYEIADIVAEHIILSEYYADKPIREKEIVYYADKRVNHDGVVSLEERLKYLLNHYGGNEKFACDRIRMNFSLCQEVEQKLFSKLSFSPDEVARLLGRQAVKSDRHP